MRRNLMDYISLKFNERELHLADLYRVFSVTSMMLKGVESSVAECPFWLIKIEWGVLS